MYFKTIPGFLINAFPGLIWKIATENTIFLSFDDGPNPETTPRILDILNKYNAKASFFLLGEQAEKYPHLVRDIRREGHLLAWHGYKHLNGWKTELKEYLDNLEACQKIFQSNIFRPPYGRITKSQYSGLSDKYQIVMWSHMPGDFDSRQDLTAIENTVQKIPSNGSIVVLHDNPKSIEKCLRALETILTRKEINFRELSL